MTEPTPTPETPEAPEADVLDDDQLDEAAGGVGYGNKNTKSPFDED